jgi:hypothetical protein
VPELVGIAFDPGQFKYSRKRPLRAVLYMSLMQAKHGANLPEGHPVTRIIFSAYNPLKNKGFYGGGGGSRTPVRKALRAEDYMLSSVQFFSPAALRMSKKRSRLVRWFSPEPYGPKGSSQPAE